MNRKLILRKRTFSKEIELKMEIVKLNRIISDNNFFISRLQKEIATLKGRIAALEGYELDYLRKFTSLTGIDFTSSMSFSANSYISVSNDGINGTNTVDIGVGYSSGEKSA